MMEDSYQDDNTFTYNFSAFLSAFRSITFYMQHEYAGSDGFYEWYSKKKIEMSTDDELKFLSDARTDNVHKEYIPTVATRGKGFSIDMLLRREGETQTWSEEAKNNAPTNTSGKTLRRFFEQYLEIDAVQFCEKQLAKIRGLVEDCDTQFR